MKKSIYSSWTGSDVTELEGQIKEANKVYLQRLAEYNYSIQVGHQDYARKNRLPAVNAAKAALDSLEKRLEQMQASISKAQNIDLVDISTNKATTEEPTGTNWRTIGLAVGALIVIVIIIKFIK